MTTIYIYIYIYTHIFPQGLIITMENTLAGHQGIPSVDERNPPPRDGLLHYVFFDWQC